MGSIIKVTKFNLDTFFNIQIIICSAVLLIHLLISIVAIELADAEGPVGSNDIVVMCYAMAMGLVFFPPVFRYILSQGISRKRLFLAMTLSIVFLAAIFASLSIIFYLINLKIANVWMVYEIIYSDRSIPGIVTWVFAASFSLGMLGWLIRIIYYVSSRNMKIAISVAPLIIVPLLFLSNTLADGRIFHEMGLFFGKVMGYTTISPNPYIGVASMLAAAAIIGVPIFLLLRRAQIKD